MLRKPIALLLFCITILTACAIGMATGLEYEPGLYSSTEEVIRIGREAGLPVHIAHIKLADRDYSDRSTAEFAFDQGKPTMAYSGQIISGDSQ